ncbi:hypothetical protein CFBP498_49270 (plasmid) [Xanthomonas hortorum pv. vitians]|uniref:Uncharacterized protein n=1 Tax=Xanthomonas hortorum pv. vitians TaxID=83224 RepID=A0A6V7FIY7_9XANT|nr:hypothetical protein CFBP498_49270 [Xanthomonas hortorum pv. vitians]CAD0363715.1 hypothetical protein CFBP498_49270 [Xanthomonas hortorum pv. vitians]
MDHQGILWDAQQDKALVGLPPCRLRVIETPSDLHELPKRVFSSGTTSASNCSLASQHRANLQAAAVAVSYEIPTDVRQDQSLRRPQSSPCQCPRRTVSTSPSRPVWSNLPSFRVALWRIADDDTIVGLISVRLGSDHSSEPVRLMSPPRGKGTQYLHIDDLTDDDRAEIPKRRFS